MHNEKTLRIHYCEAGRLQYNILSEFLASVYGVVSTYCDIFFLWATPVTTLTYSWSWRWHQRLERADHSGLPHALPNFLPFIAFFHPGCDSSPSSTVRIAV